MDRRGNDLIKILENPDHHFERKEKIIIKMSLEEKGSERERKKSEAIRCFCSSSHLEYKSALHVFFIEQLRSSNSRWLVF